MPKKRERGREKRPFQSNLQVKNLKPPQPPPLPPHPLIPIPTLIPLVVIVVEIHPVRLALQAGPRHLAVDADVLDQRVQRDVVVFRPDVAQDQQVEVRGVEIGEFVEGYFLPCYVSCGGGGGGAAGGVAGRGWWGERGHDVDFLLRLALSCL